MMPLIVLLVEDNPADADLLIDNLTTDSLGGAWQIIHVERLREALLRLDQQSVDVVLLDLSLPDSQGLDGISQIQTVAPSVPIVMLTGRDDTQIAVQAVARGAQDYLVKGQITIQLLTQAIRYAVERTQILKQLQSSERLFRAVFDQTFQFMVLLSPSGIILQINQALVNLEGFRPETVLHCPIWETDRWGYDESIQQWMKNAIATAAQGQMVREEVQVRSAQGELRWLDFLLKPLKDETNQVILLIAESHDISDRKLIEAKTLQALERERELNHLKADFVTMASHEFRTPLTIILTVTELLQNYSHKLTEEKCAQHFEHIHSAIAAMMRLLDEVLLLGKTDSSGLHYDPNPFELTAYCRELIETLQLTINSSHRIIFHCSNQQIQGEMDQVLIHHILTNLLSNAVKYSPARSSVWVDLSCQKDHVTFKIKDEGIGIPLADQQRLFETFYRANNVGKIQGTGLGLAIVKKCVDLHQGQIQVESEVGKGTTFSVMLPRFSTAN